MKISKSIIWPFIVVALAIGVFLYFFLGEASKTLPKIRPSYFVNETEIADSIFKILNKEMTQTPFYWLGIEPEKPEQVPVVLELIKQIQQTHKIVHLFVDSELKLQPELFNQAEFVALKANIFEIGEKLAQLEKEKTPYILLTASIYSTNFLKENPIYKIKTNYSIKPLSFSFAFLPTNVEDENQMTFRCSTDDKSGISDWACFVLNKSRFVRRKLKLSHEKNWSGLMDLSGETDYVVLLKRK